MPGLAVIVRSHLCHDKLLPFPISLVALPTIHVLGEVQTGEQAVLSKGRAEQPSSVGQCNAVVVDQLGTEQFVDAGAATVDPSEFWRQRQKLANQVFAS